MTIIGECTKRGLGFNESNVINVVTHVRSGTSHTLWIATNVITIESQAKSLHPILLAKYPVINSMVCIEFGSGIHCFHCYCHEYVL